MARNRTFRAALAAVVAATLLFPSALRAQPPGPTLPDMIDQRTAKAIERGLKFLAKTQRNDGGWLNQGWYGAYPTSMTSLAALALMAGGSTPESGPYAVEVTRAMNFVLRGARAQADGLLTAPGVEGRSMYGHGFGMLFLAQCYGTELSKEYEKELKDALDKAVKLTAQSQSDLGAKERHAGGWYYTPGSRSDEGSVTVTQLQALRACRNAGINVPKSTIGRAALYLKYCQMADGGICYQASSRRYRGAGSSRPAISAAAIACFYAAGLYDRTKGASGEEAEMVEKLVKYVKSHVRVDYSGGHWFYTHYYMAQAMYQRGEKDWKEYFPRLRDRLLSMQSPDGSWNGDSIGTTYGTAIATTVLQLPYGYLPLYQR